MNRQIPEFIRGFTGAGMRGLLLFLVLLPGIIHAQGAVPAPAASPSPTPVAPSPQSPSSGPAAANPQMPTPTPAASSVPPVSSLPEEGPGSGQDADLSLPPDDIAPSGTPVPETPQVPESTGMKVLHDLGFELVINQDPSVPLVPGDYLTTVSPDGAPADDVHLLVKSVRGNKIFARVVWASRPVLVGDPVKKLGRLGLDIDAFVGTVLEFDNKGYYSGFYIEPGVRFAWTWGLYGFRPALRLGFPMGSDSATTFSDLSTWLPISTGLDLEYSYYLDRFRIQPQFGLSGITCIPLAGQPPAFAGIRVEGAVRFGLSFDQWTELYVEAGYLRHFGELLGYEGGLHFGLGLTIK